MQQPAPLNENFDPNGELQSHSTLIDVKPDEM